MTFVNDISTKPWKTIDRDRNIVLSYKEMSGGSASNIEVFELRLQDYILGFSSKRTVIDNGQKGDIQREILGISIPQSLHIEFNELVNVIKEALETYGEVYHREFVDNVFVTLSPNLQINGMKI